jgi:ribosome-binding factor A
MDAPRMPTQRQLRVGEELRSAIAQIFAHGETHVPELDSASITVSEVRISPDLKNATVFFMPLAGKDKEKVLKTLLEERHHIRHLLTKRVVLRHLPRLHFKLDHSFEEAHRVHQILNEVKKKESGE